MTVLRTARLVLRPLRAEDAEAFHAFASDWEVASRVASWPWPGDRAFTEQRLSKPQPGEGIRTAILCDGTLVGSAGVEDGEIGYMLARSAWGRGYATEACTALLDFAFATTPWPEISAGVFADNDASMRVLEKLGFARLGQGTHGCRAQGRDLPTVTFLLTREAWQRRADPAVPSGLHR